MDSVYMTVVILAGILLVITRWLKSLILQQDYRPRRAAKPREPHERAHRLLDLRPGRHSALVLNRLQDRLGNVDRIVGGGEAGHGGGSFLGPRRPEQAF